MEKANHKTSAEQDDKQFTFEEEANDEGSGRLSISHYLAFEVTQLEKVNKGIDLYDTCKDEGYIADKMVVKLEIVYTGMTSQCGASDHDQQKYDVISGARRNVNVEDLY